jgi:hypothetical protein
LPVYRQKLRGLDKNLKGVMKGIQLGGYLVPIVCMVCSFALESNAAKYIESAYDLWGWYYLHLAVIASNFT